MTAATRRSPPLISPRAACWRRRRAARASSCSTARSSRPRRKPGAQASRCSNSSAMSSTSISSAGNSRTQNLETSERYLPDLFWPKFTVKPNPRTVNIYFAEGHNRISAPFYAIAFGLIAMAAITRGRRARGALRVAPHRCGCLGRGAQAGRLRGARHRRAQSAALRAALSAAAARHRRGAARSLGLRVLLAVHLIARVRAG